jgi:excinuclease ABC subunit A
MLPAAREPAPIVVRGARTHNLKNIDVSLPAGRLVVITGVSGSGKSSLAFDTVYAEGQRRYVESLSAYARQFLERMEKPDVDRIDGICPSIAIRQKNSVRNPRSTVGTVTEIHDYMRLLFARVGRTFCRQCGQEVVRETAEVVATRLLALTEGTRVILGFDLPVVALTSDGSAPTDEPDSESRSTDPVEGEEIQPSLLDEPTERAATTEESDDAIRTALDTLRRKGFGRVLVGGQAVAIEDVDPAEFRAQPSIQVVVDRLRIEGALRARFTDSIETAYQEGGGAAWALELPSTNEAIEGAGTRTVHVFSERFECRRCHITYEDPQPRLFSFNNPFGACPTCHGFGNIIELDLDLVVPDPSKSIAQGAIEPWSKPHYRSHLAELKRAAKGRDLRLDVPWRDLSDDDRRFVVEGDGGDYEGIRGFFRWLERKKYKVHVRVFLSRYRGYLTCPDCAGTRLRREARDVRVGDLTIDRVSALTVREAQSFFAELRLSEKEAAIADKVLKEIRRRLGFLSDVGLDYLTLDRLSSTLSGGEAQRINLATSLGASLVGTLYVLDEPSIGLHTRDNQRLITILRQLRDQGNTVLVVEHDADMIMVADHVIDMGLGAGEHGGGNSRFTSPPCGGKARHSASDCTALASTT